MHLSSPDLLLLDMHLPKYDGEAVLKRLRSTEHYAQIPVVVMTSSDAPQDHDRAQRHAALFYFRKPSRLEEFIQLGVVDAYGPEEQAMSWYYGCVANRMRSALMGSFAAPV